MTSPANPDEEGLGPSSRMPSSGQDKPKKRKWVPPPVAPPDATSVRPPDPTRGGSIGTPGGAPHELTQSNLWPPSDDTEADNFTKAVAQRSARVKARRGK